MTTSSQTNPPAPPGHLAFIDLIRGVSALAVFLFHATGVAFGTTNAVLPWDGLFRSWDVEAYRLWLWPLTYGWAGVASFFVVSGFCIHLSHSKSQEKGWGYYLNRRVFRIFPPYLLAMALFFFVPPWGAWEGLSAEGGWFQFITHLLAVHNLFEPTFYGINGSFWSIGVEWQLYLVYPALWAMARRWGWKTSLGISGGIHLVILLWHAGSWFGWAGPPYWLKESPFAYWMSWSIGAYLCECHQSGRPMPLRRFRLDLALLLAVGTFLFRPSERFSFLFFALATAVVMERFLSGRWNWAALTGGRSKRVVGHLTFLGVLSYSFYLFHQPVLELLGSVLFKLFGHTDFPPLALFGFSLSFYPLVWALAYAGYYLVEKPAIRMGHRVYGRLSRKP